MTEHVRSNYRKHRKATWGFAIAVMVAVAAVVIPIASGASDKTYTMLFPAGAVTPAPPVSGNTSQTLCSNSDYTVKVAITNTAKSVQLGAADVTFPANVTLSGATFPAGSPAAWQISRSGQVVSLRQLSLPKGNTVTIVAALHTAGSVSAAQSIIAKVKQSNDFNDTGGDANTFSNPTFPTISVQVCAATITGRVYHDRDQSGSFAIADPNNPSPTSDIAKQGWKVTLWQKTPQNTYAKVDQELSDANGMYSVTGPIGKDSLLCATPNADDSTTSWGVRAVAGVTLADGCQAGDAAKGLSVTPLPSAGKTGQDFAVVPITTPDFAPGDTATDGNYIVQAAGSGGKDPQHYVQETWTDNGHPYFVFAPINACTGCPGKIYLLEQMSGSVLQSDLGPTHQVELVYDDTEPFTQFDPMPYCLQDPRVNLTPPITLREDHVLPAGATSCIVDGHQWVSGDGTVANAKANFKFIVYTSYDGLRGAA